MSRFPQNTVTDQIISGGIAAMNPNPDPLMGAAMGAPPPMMGQDPMMGQMQDPMMQPPMQDPMMGQMPQDIAMGPADASRPNDATANARSYDARSHDAARDNGCGWRHGCLTGCLEVRELLLAFTAIWGRKSRESLCVDFESWVER